MSVGSYEVSYRPSALAHGMAQWSVARPDWRAAGGSNRGSGIRFFRTASPHTPYISAFLGRPPRPQAPNLSIFWTGLPAGTPKIYPHRWTAFVRIFRGPVMASKYRIVVPTELRPSDAIKGSMSQHIHEQSCLRSEKPFIVDISRFFEELTDPRHKSKEEPCPTSTLKIILRTNPYIIDNEEAQF